MRKTSLNRFDFLSNENLHLIGADRKIHGAPDLVIEILSPSNRNHDLKKKKPIGFAREMILDLKGLLLVSHAYNEHWIRHHMSFLKTIKRG